MSVVIMMRKLYLPHCPSPRNPTTAKSSTPANAQEVIDDAHKLDQARQQVWSGDGHEALRRGTQLRRGEDQIFRQNLDKTRLDGTEFKRRHVA